MKNTVLIMAFALFSASALAQSDSGFGIKAGLNYNGNGDYFDSAQIAFENPERNAGFHIGVFGKLGNRIYLRPELFYTSTTSNYDEGNLKLQRLDAPLLLGFKVIGPAHVFLGPAFQYILDSKFDAISVDAIENDFTVGLHVGAGVNLGRLGIDVRYERGFSENEINLINTSINFVNINDRVDTRPEQIILSLSLKI